MMKLNTNRIIFQGIGYTAFRSYRYYPGNAPINFIQIHEITSFLVKEESLIYMNEQLSSLKEDYVLKGGWHVWGKEKTIIIIDKFNILE